MSNRDFLKLLHEFHTWEMATSLTKEDTGLDCIVWVSTQMASHGPRVKVGLNMKDIKTRYTLSVSISDNPEVQVGQAQIPRHVLNGVFQWIRVNRDVLLQYWDGQIGTRKLVNLLKDV